MKLYTFFFLFFLNSSVAFSQVLFLNKTPNTILFGPKNVYPISESICNYYINAIRIEKEKSFHDIQDSLVYKAAFDQLIQDWKQTKMALKEIQEICFELKFNEMTYEELDLKIEIVEYSQEDLVEVFEYIDITKSRLKKEQWKKQKVRDCYSTDPDDCYVLCLITFEEEYFNVFDEVIDPELLLETFDLSKTMKRMYKSYEIDVEGGKTYSLLNIDLDEYFSIMEMTKIDCHE